MTSTGRLSSRGRSRSKPASYPPQIWLLLGGSFLVRALGFAYPFLSYFVVERGQGMTVVSFVLAAFGAGWVVGQLVCGSLVDRIGGRLTLVAAMTAAAVVLCLLTVSHGVPMLVVGAALFGLAFDAPRPVVSAAIAELIPDSAQRAKIDAFRYGWVVNAGGAITGALGGLLAIRIGVAALFLVHAAACATFAALAWWFLPGRAGSAKPSGALSGYRQALADSRLVFVYLSSLATLTAMTAVLADMPMLMSQQGLGADAFGWAQLTNAVGVAALTPVVTPWLSKRIAVRPRLDILVAASMWTSFCMAAAAYATTTAQFSLACLGVAAGETAWFVVAVGIVHRIAPSTRRGVYHGIWATALPAAWIVSPLLTSFSLGHGGPHMVAATTMAVGLLGAVICVPLARRLSVNPM
ncbi:MFS transporter [Mycolicibacterium pulveris]|uniref:MFS transporter n=1 Tax=Mycolicibacterium pulveris TaxID=36813 RepID=UPI003CEC51E8